VAASAGARPVSQPPTPGSVPRSVICHPSTMGRRSLFESVPLNYFFTQNLLLHSKSFDESREMWGDRTREGVVLVLKASPNCRQRNPSRMPVAFREMRSVTVQMNAAVDETGCAFRFPCHGLTPGAKSMSLYWNLRTKRKRFCDCRHTCVE